MPRTRQQLVKDWDDYECLKLVECCLKRLREFGFTQMMKMLEHDPQEYRLPTIEGWRNLLGCEPNTQLVWDDLIAQRARLIEKLDLEY